MQGVHPPHWDLTHVATGPVACAVLDFWGHMQLLRAHAELDDVEGARFALHRLEHRARRYPEAVAAHAMRVTAPVDQVLIEIAEEAAQARARDLANEVA